MRRGITPVVAIALLLGMTVAASGGAYTFISSAQQQAQEDATTSLSTQVAVRGLRCEDATVNVTLKNTGDSELTDSILDAFLYRDGELVTTSEVDVSSAEVLQPNGLTTISLPFVLDPGTRYTLELRFPQDDVSVERTCQASLAHLAGYWDFETKAPGTVTDAARNNDGTYENNERDGTLQSFDFTDDSGWIDGKVGSHALRFDGTDDEVRVPADDALYFEDAHAMSLELWLYLDNIRSGWEEIVEQLGSTGFKFYTHDKGGLRIFTENETDSGDCHHGGWKVDNRTWAHAVATYDDGTWKIYVNGDEKSSAGDAQCDTAFDSTALRINPGSVKGNLDAVRVYDRTLPAPVVEDLFQGQDVRDGLVGEWTFDEGNGTTAHDTSKWIAGKVGDYALTLDGADDYVNVSDGGGLSPGEITVSIWVKAEDLPFSDWSRIITKREHTAGEGGYQLVGNDGTDMVRFELTDASPQNHNIDSPALTEGQWHHLVMVADNSTLTGYMDGVEFGSISAQFSHSPENLYFGSRDSPSRFFNGSIDDARIYSTALTAEQVAALHDATS